MGRPYTSQARESLGLQVYQERCSAWDNSFFACDTNYRKSKSMTVEEIMATEEVSNARRVCITGGEPLMHDLLPLMEALLDADKYIHIETSGTLDLTPLRFEGRRHIIRAIWICVSPKAGYLEDSLRIANEIKVLVDRDFDQDKFYKAFYPWIESGRVWIQPVNGEHELNHENIARCLKLQEIYPALRLSLQTHKIMKVR